MLRRWKARRRIARMYEQAYQRRLHAKRNYDDWLRHGVKIDIDF
jgi:hypothetical protein